MCRGRNIVKTELKSSKKFSWYEMKQARQLVLIWLVPCRLRGLPTEASIWGMEALLACMTPCNFQSVRHGDFPESWKSTDHQCGYYGLQEIYSPNVHKVAVRSSPRQDLEQRKMTWMKDMWQILNLWETLCKWWWYMALENLRFGKASYQVTRKSVGREEKTCIRPHLAKCFHTKRGESEENCSISKRPGSGRHRKMVLSRIWIIRPLMVGKEKVVCCVLQTVVLLKIYHLPWFDRPRHPWQPGGCEYRYNQYIYIGYVFLYPY